ncbi:MAG TPA: divalent-cation tolerance protein CutA [Acidimicrobiales bacterium]|nr:divalent-cation tolerance protein CutA [Acidimicrobiales bacterium]
MGAEADKVVVLVAAADRDQARTIAGALVERRQAACVQLLPIESVYRWEGQVQHDDEVLLLVKSRTDQLAAIEATVCSLHTYEVPEVVVLDVAGGHVPYLGWIDASLDEAPDAG